MVSQQVGYQVGDFFVQVQSGQNKMVAFTQQATQLAGLLPGLGGAVVGISLSLIGMAYQMNKATSSTASLAKNVEELSKLLKDFQDASKAIGDASDNFGVFADYTKDALINLREISRIKLDESIKGILGGDIKRGMGLVGGKIQEVMTSGQALQIKEFLGGDNRSAGKANREVSQFATARSAFAGAEGTQQQLVAAQKLSDVFVSIVGDYGDMNAEQKDFYASLQNVIIEIAKLGKSIPNPQKAYVDSLTAALKLQTAQDDYNRSVEQAVKLYGRVRQQAKDLADKEQESYNNKLKIGLALYTNLRLQAKQLADKDQESSNNKIQTGIALYVGLRQQAKDLADKEQESYNNKLITGIALYTNLRLQAKGLADEIQRAADAAIDPKAFKFAGMMQQYVRSRMEAPATPVSHPDKMTTEPSGTALKDLEAEFIARSNAFRLGESELSLYEQQLKIKQALGDYSKLYTEEELLGIAQRFEARAKEDQQLQDLRDRNEELANTIASSFEDSFTSIVDGTKRQLKTLSVRWPLILLSTCLKYLLCNRCYQLHWRGCWW
jgi:hypothetical protein